MISNNFLYYFYFSRQCLRDAFVELYEQPLLEELLSSLEIRFPDIEFPPIPKRGTLDVKSVKKSQYFFH